jgi:hypothetical protein
MIQFLNTKREKYDSETKNESHASDQDMKNENDKIHDSFLSNRQDRRNASI